MTTDAAGGRTLIYLHGRNFKPARDSLRDIVTAALATGIERDHPEQAGDFRSLDIRLAYYGDHVNRLLADAGEHYDERLDLGDMQNALQHLKGLERRKKFSLTAYDRLPGKSAIPELAADVAAPILGSIGLSKKVISKVAPDLDAYWQADGTFAASIRDAVREVIVDALAAGRQVMLMSHGSGSIVAWDVLWQLSCDDRYVAHRDHKIDTWVTLGSPLGDNSVRKRLLGAGEKDRRRYPSNIVSWHNVAAEDDWLCHDNTVADDFKPMLKQKQVSAIRDYRVYNLSVRYGKSDPNCSLGYLVHPRVAQLVIDWLSRPALATPVTRTS